MKTKLHYILFAALLGFSSMQCTNPIEDIEVNVNADVIRYSTVIELKDLSSGTIPSTLNVAVTGEHAGAVYDLGGFKKLTINDGVISLGVDPRMEPTAGKPVTFDVTVSGPNYLPVTIPVTISVEDLSQIKVVNMINITNPPPGVAVTTKTATVTGGTITAPMTMSTTAEAGEPEVTTVAIPAGTQFKNAAGAVITSGTLSVTVVQFDTEQSSSLNSFPGGGYASENFVNASGQEGIGTFNPAGFSEISMSIGGVPVKTFNQPINLSVVLDPSYIMEGTNSPVKAGDVFNVSSYDQATGKWKMESDGTVVNTNGKLTLNFTTNHLSWFSWGRSRWYPMPPTPPYTYLAVTAPEIESTVPVRVELSYANGNVVFQRFTGVLSPKTSTFFYAGLLPTGQSYKYSITNLITSQVVATGTFTGGTTSTISVTVPVPANNIVNMSLTVRCPGKSVVLTPPDFYLYYRLANSTDKEFVLLGLVTGGKFSTSELKLNTLYDFKAVWGSKTFVTVNKMVTLSNSMQLDDKNYGKYQQTLNMLVEECK